MNRRVATIAIVVPDYDQAINYYVGRLGFSLVEDTQMSLSKRWVLVSPGGGENCTLLLAKADSDAQRSAIGKQTGDRVFLFLHTDDFDRDYATFTQAGVTFLETPRDEIYGKVAVFQDIFGNKWDLIEPKNTSS